MGKVESLRDCILKSTVVNFDKIFFENGGAKQVKKHICLPPMLFEDIQDKSNEMCWVIPPKSLNACLSNRDALNWMNIELRVGALRFIDVLQIGKSDFPIKRLSFRTNHLTDAMLYVIEKFSSTIEVLEIDCHTDSDFNSVTNKSRDQTLLKFPKLRCLSIGLFVVPVELLQRFDFSSCSDSLKKLCLSSFINLSGDKEMKQQLIMTFVDSLKVLKNLESLTIEDEDICIKMNSFAHLKNLRTLWLDYMPSNIPPGQSLVNLLPKLENLTLPEDNLIRELNSLNGRKLNYAGSYFRADVPDHLKQVAKNFGSATNLQSYVTFLDHCSYLNYITYAFDFVKMLPNMFYQTQDKSILFKGCDIRKVEKAILAYMTWGLFDREYCANVIRKYKDIWSQNFIIEVINLLTSLQISEDESWNYELSSHFLKLLEHQPLIDYKKRYIALNPNSSISKMYKKVPPIQSNGLKILTILCSVTILVLILFLFFS